MHRSTTVLLGLVAAGLAGGCARTPRPTPPPAPAGTQLLFVQTARGVSYGDGRLTLHDVAPTTLFFTDRPQRLAGHVATPRFLADWDRGRDNFAADPPNATLSVFGGRAVSDSVVELSRPRLRGRDLVYDVRLLAGAPPRRGGAASLFIDPVGRLGAPFPLVERPGLVQPYTYAYGPYVYDPSFAPPMPPPSTAGTGPYGDLTNPAYYGQNPYAQGYQDPPPQAYTFE